MPKKEAKVQNIPKPNMCENAPCEQICIKSPTQGLGWAPHCFKAMKTWPPAAKRSPSSAENNTVKVYLAKCWQITRPFLKNAQANLHMFAFLAASNRLWGNTHASYLIFQKNTPQESQKQIGKVLGYIQRNRSWSPYGRSRYPATLYSEILPEHSLHIFKVVELICMNARRANTTTLVTAWLHTCWKTSKYY